MRLFYITTYIATVLVITSLLFGAVFYFYDFAFAAGLELPSECSGNEYDIVTVGDNNSTVIDAGNGKDCILVGNNNSAEINAGNGSDIIVVGYDNSGNINCGNGPDTIVIGEGNTGIIDEENCPDTITTVLRPTPSPTPTPIFLPQDGTESATTSVKVTQNFEINIISSSGNSQVVLEQDTVISRIASEQFSVSQLTSSTADVNTLTGLAEGKVFEAALQWGILDTTLQFSKPITIKIFVGTELDGKTLDVVRSPDGQAWTNEGIVAPATCLVSAGICSFQATMASYYAALGTVPVSAPSGAVVPLAFLNSGAGILPTPSPTVEVVVVPIPSSAPEISPTPIPKVVSIPPKVSKLAVAKVQKTPEPTPAIHVELKPEPATAKNLLSNILSSIFGLFHWPF